MSAYPLIIGFLRNPEIVLPAHGVAVFKNPGRPIESKKMALSSPTKLIITLVEYPSMR
jgi:hypothetical protein